MFLKRVCDIACALLALAVLTLPMAVVALAVRLTSKGPALYWSQRVGRGNSLFWMPKFRTMRTDTPVVATHFLGDPARHLTPIGNFPRKTSLDELGDPRQGGAGCRTSATMELCFRFAHSGHDRHKSGQCGRYPALGRLRPSFSRCSGVQVNTLPESPLVSTVVGSC